MPVGVVRAERGGCGYSGRGPSPAETLQQSGQGHHSPHLLPFLGQKGGSAVPRALCKSFDLV